MEATIPNDVLTHYHYDDAKDSLIVHRTQDVNPIIEQVKREKNDFSGYKSETFNKVGTIPAIIIEQYLQEFGVTYQEFIEDNTHIKRIMNNPDYSKFKILTGKL